MNPSKRKMYAILAGVGISLGAAGIASAASTPSTAPVVASASASAAAVTVATTPTDPTTPASTTASTGTASTAAADTTAADTTDGGHTQAAPTYTSSVTVPVAADGSEPTDAALQAVATVTADQATAAALASTPGTAGATELKSYAGNVVWEVDVTATAGGSYDVVIDAGNSAVLDSHVEGGGGRGGDHAARTPSFTSSVTVPVASDGTKPTDAALQAVATVTADQATAAALASTPGTAGTTELKSYAGNVVWEVDVTATAGGSDDVVIDAGNSAVLDSHVEGGGGRHHGGRD